MISNSIRIPSPYSIFLSGIALYIFVLIINPSEPNYWGNLEGWSYVFLSFISILFGIAVGSRKIIFEQKMRTPGKHTNIKIQKRRTH